LKISIVIPVYNEKETFLELLEAVKKASVCGLEKEIVIVDDFSKDGTREILAVIKRDNVKIFFHEQNTGKGGALRTGFKKATGDIVMVQDADMEYDPGEYEKLLLPIIENKADIVYGSRFLAKGSGKTAYSAHKFANLLLTFLSNLFSGVKVSDMETCYKVFRKEIIKDVDIEENRFGFEPEITAKMAKIVREKKARLKEVPISYNARSYEEGKKIGLKDGIRALWCILKYNDSGFATVTKYSLSGVLVAASQYAAIIFMVEVLGLSSVIGQNIANVISILISFAVAFILHSAFTWRYRFVSSREVASKFAYFLGVSFFSLLLRSAVFYALSLTGIDYRLNVLVGIVVILAVNFSGYGRLVFSRKPV